MTCKHLILLLVLTLLPAAVCAEIVVGSVLVDGKATRAEYTVLEDGTVGLGTGCNACISHYTKGRVTVPSEITVIKRFPIRSEKTYKVTQIMPFAFRMCNSLEVVVVKEGITRIGDFAFIGCLKLTELELPSTLETVATGAFQGLENLYLMTCKSVTPPVWEYNDVFFRHHVGGIFSIEPPKQYRAGVALNVPAESAEAYREAIYSDPDIGWQTPEGWGTAFSNINGSGLENFRLYEPIDVYDLQRIANNPERFGVIKNVWLEADINMEDSIFTEPIGSTPDHAFTAPVHGQGHSISGLRIITDSVAGFFGYYAGPFINGLHLTGMTVSGSTAGGIAGVVTSDCRIDSSLVSLVIQGGDYAGGIVGETRGRVAIDRCMVEFCTLYAPGGLAAGIVAQANGAVVTNCGVLARLDVKPGAPFIGGGSGTVDFAYASDVSFKGYRPPSTVSYGEHVICEGDPLHILDYAGDPLDFNYEDRFFRSVYPAAKLGLEAWAFKSGEYPVPDCFADRWQTRVNMAAYGTVAMAARTVNVLTPDEAIPSEAWLDLSERGFRHYRFKTSQLWIDKNIDVNGQAEHLPIGLSRQIVAEEGVLLKDTLCADSIASRPVYAPIYQVDEAGNTLYDAKGEKILIDSMFLYNETQWLPTMHPLCLPYNVALPTNCTLYQPTSIYDLNGQTTALFERVRENYVEAFKPYYLIVHVNDVPLGTKARTVCPAVESNAMRLGDYTYQGSMTRINNVKARKDELYKLDSSNSWLHLKESSDLTFEVMPYTAYFRAEGKTPAKRITIQLEDGNPVISVGDFYYRINNSNPDQVTATLVGYHGRGGNAVVPAAAPYVASGIQHMAPVTGIGPGLFARTTAELYSVDFSACTQLQQPVSIDRAEPSNPFYKLDERTILYMPEGKVAPAQGLQNVVVGTSCERLLLTDGWDFRPPYDFHADEAVFDRIYYASKLKDGSYEPYAYSLCLPFSMTKDDVAAALDGKMQLYYMKYVDEERKCFAFTDYGLTKQNYPVAGKPYLLKMFSGQFQPIAHDTQVLKEPATDDEDLQVLDYKNNLATGSFRGSFKRIGNEEAAHRHLFTLNSGKWCRIRSDEARYRNAWVGAFRAFFEPETDVAYNTYKTYYIAELHGGFGSGTVYVSFPTSVWAIDTDFTGYDFDDDETGIDGLTPDAPSPKGRGEACGSEGGDSWHTLDGRRISQPSAPGLYLNRGKKVMVK